MCMLATPLLAFMMLLLLVPAAVASNVPEITLACGQKYDISDLTTGAYQYSDPQDFNSSDSSVAKVEYDDYGTVYVKAGQPGKATVYQVYLHDTAALITVKAAQITRNGAGSFTLGLFRTKQLSVQANMPNAPVNWSSTNKKVVTVNSKGVVTAQGAGKATIRATSPHGNTVQWTVTVPKVKASKVAIAKIKKQSYTGKKVKPALKITYAGKQLKAGTHYKVKYKKNKAIGKAKAIITFKGSFTGKRTKAFRIVKPKVGKPTITYWFHGDAYSKIEWDSGTNSTGTELRIVGGGNPKYDKHIKGDWGYGYCYKSRIGSSVKFSIRSYKSVKGKKFYSKWVRMRL